MTAGALGQVAHGVLRARPIKASRPTNPIQSHGTETMTVSNRARGKGSDNGAN